MANISAYAAKAMLDWVDGGATPTQPSARYVNLSLGSPTSVSGSEITTGSGCSRQTAAFAAAASPAGSASNSAAMTFGPFSSTCSVSGVNIWDTNIALTGNLLWYGLLANPRTLTIGDSVVLPIGGLVTTLG